MDWRGSTSKPLARLSHRRSRVLKYLPGAFLALLIFLAGIGMVVLIGVMQVIGENMLSRRDVEYEALCVT
jgi:uncharacterized membrane protein YjgN (DUF898 family)